MYLPICYNAFHASMLFLWQDGSEHTVGKITLHSAQQLQQLNVNLTSKDKMLTIIKIILMQLKMELKLVLFSSLA